MDVYEIIRLFLIGFLLLLSAGFSSSETALFSIDRVILSSLYKINPKVASSIEKLRNDPRSLLTTVLVGNELVNTSVAVLVSGAVYSFMKDKVSLAAIGGISVGIGTFILLVAGEITPKAIAIRYPAKVSAMVLPLIATAEKILFPVLWVIRGPVEKLLDRLIGKGTPKTAKEIDEAVFKSMVAAGEREGVIEETEREMIHKIFAFDDLVVSDVMTPRTEIFMLPVDITYEEAVKQISEKKFSRVPVYKDDEDNIIGILYAKALLKYHLSHKDVPSGIEEFLVEPLFVPAGKKVVDLFREFRAKRIQMAVVVDEYGGVLGIVTMEDLLEELFGEIRDEYDQREVTFKKLSDGVYVFSGRESFDDFCRVLKIDKPVISAKTVNGLFMSLLGHLPKEGEEVELQGWILKAEEVRGTRIYRIRAERKRGGD